MKVENLKVGLVVKNYKALCELLEIEPQKANSKKAQLKEMNRYFRYSQIGHKFTIEEIFETPLDKLDARGKKSVYGDIIQVLLMDLLSRNNGRIITSKTKLTKELGLVNDNYSLGFGQQAKLSNYLSIDLDYVKDFYNTSNSNITSIIDTALKSLQSKFLIDVNTITMVRYQDEDEYKVADEFDRTILQEINRYCLEHFGMTDLKFSKRDKKYYQFIEMRDLLLSQRTRIKSTYKAYDIVVNRKFIDKEQNKLSENIMSELDRQGKLLELNQLFSNNVIDNAENRHSNYSSSEKLLLLRFSKVYVKNFKTMTYNLINLKADKISHKLLNSCELSNEQLSDISDLPF